MTHSSRATALLFFSKETHREQGIVVFMTK
jgi:hypothetical protein